MARTICSVICLSACVSLWAQTPAPPVTPASAGHVELRVDRAALRDTILLMAGGSGLQLAAENGTWLVVSLEVTTPGPGFASTPTLAGAGLPAAREPRGISGDSAPANDAPFLQYASKPAFVPLVHIPGKPGWVGLKKGGAYGGAGFIGQSNSLDFMVTSAPRLEFMRAGRMTLTLAFDVSGGRGPYVLSIGGATAAVSVSARAGRARP